MKWTTKDCYGNTKTWYSEDVIEEIKQRCRCEIDLDNWGKFFAQKILKIINEVDK